MSLVYSNRVIWNQRGASITVDNSTEREKINISQRSGSNTNITNVVNSELATNNKQVNVVHDSFETVGNDKSEFIGKNHTFRTGENIYHLKGFINQTQLDAFNDWKEAYQPIADLNAQFKILRAGEVIEGERADNPVLKNRVFVVNNDFNGYTGVPIRRSSQDDVTSYVKVPDRNNTKAASINAITKDDIQESAGISGSKAPGVLEFGPEKSAATEDGLWVPNLSAVKIDEVILDKQNTLTPIEKEMGHGGDETYFTKRNKIEQIGAVFNDYPSVRIDEKGRSQPLEMLVCENGAYKNHDYQPHIEEVDNSSNFPGGNDDKIVGNRYSRLVGSGGIQLKTTGPTEMGGTTLKGGYKRINLNASHGVQIASEAFVEIQSLKSITLRTNRQVYVDGAVGVKGNLVVGGGAYIEGELYCQHITAPLEVHQTQDTIVLGKFATDSEGSLLIGYAHVGSAKYPVYASPKNDLIVNYPHSHYHNGIPMRLTKSNKDVRNFAKNEQINNHSNISQSLAQKHERKTPQVSN